ncbi:hypothetical protein RhiirA5_349200 [Rhizophagus irregularis]|uniref:Uncharacterized protein n=3 Tax=Rhizophagus irregularis TaxID=588596 RepID=A0A2I1E5T6_9GLOM|nr:hypothetical protein GLOIN_2v1641246 [Rhizophagus irregularis DAOM 181602=DAOM 197198]EXX58836.1 hypothetical protein RirG_194250 [Rhizophagus irregularis DAOM 197198w]PKC15338.1 hypothetical protein RhiirA5_349200 [Rhizophagus irregularis]PKK74156.1 hypothetical protein RhiirC2_739397 [Rhizophagus irregularis]PKY17488.1 hypothetical protein RhiirB3_404375 [Rhizophagus irregularis]POG68020.1 hypothetical protein GLOIN_2v1641246 [Rhizophagus irregularis DAOM 181602=DAOM 197198]|eukprot:XP_025174886.1 hypothetical protein GLOIN_2v1641246 [Rhizophagus irregularis DAOM 181602=DAOM 197198]
MVNTKVVILVTLFVALLGVILSVTAAPVDRVNRRVSFVKREEKNQTTLQSDSIPVSSDGDGTLEAYNPDDKVPKNVTDNGNSAEGDNGGL